MDTKSEIESQIKKIKNQISENTLKNSNFGIKKSQIWPIFLKITI